MSKPMTSEQTSSQSFMRRTIREVFSHWGARIGLGWILLLVFVAIFAPFLANTMPLLMSREGVISAPVLDYLSTEDMVVLISAIVLAIMALIPRRFPVKSFVMVGLIVAIGTALVSSWLYPPKQVIVYQDIRADLATNKPDWAIMPPIPYAPKDYLRDAQDQPLQAPLAEGDYRHLMGTEGNGADVMSRMIHATRIALAIGFIAVGIGMFIGVIIGGLMGYFSGIVDMLGMRLVEIFESIPTLFLLLTFVAFFGSNLYIMMIIIGVTSWSGYARYIRAEFLRLRKQDYVQGAIASGLPLRSILFRHMLPNGVAPLLVAASFGIASAILAEATLSFLGLGPVDSPSWGQMLDEAVKSSTFNWWMAVYPGGAIFMTVFAYNLIGEAFRDAIDPHMTEKAGA